MIDLRINISIVGQTEKEFTPRCSGKDYSVFAVFHQRGFIKNNDGSHGTGKPFDSLSEDELATAMDDLNIDLPEDEELQADAYYEEDDAPAQEPDYLDELERLASLRDKGIITAEEFEAKKKVLLGL